MEEVLAFVFDALYIFVYTGFFIFLIRRKSSKVFIFKEDKKMFEGMFNFADLFGKLKDNVLFMVQFVGIMVAIMAVSYIVTFLIKKKNGVTEKTFSTRKIAVIGLFAAISGVLMSFELSVPLIPFFYKFEMGDLPALICGFAFGPFEGVLVIFLKILVKLVIRSTSTAFVGELGNFIISCSFVLPATIIYWLKKSKKTALIGCIVGGLVMVFCGALINQFYLVPSFLKMFFGGNVEALVGAAAGSNKYVTSPTLIVVFGAIPINILKSIANSVVCLLLYKPLSPIWKSTAKKEK